MKVAAPWVEVLQRHPALMITAAYLVVSSIGMAFSWLFFRHFGVNYFVFADLTDFLLGAVREPMSMLAAAGAAIVIWGLYTYSEWEHARLERRPDKGRLLRLYLKSNEFAMRSGWTAAAALALYMVIAVMLFADHRAEAIRDGDGVHVTVRFTDHGADAEPDRFLLMGSSARFLFLYDAPRSTTVVVANENVVKLTIADPGVADDPAELPAEADAVPETDQD